MKNFIPTLMVLTLCSASFAFADESQPAAASSGGETSQKVVKSTKKPKRPHKGHGSKTAKKPSAQPAASAPAAGGRNGAARFELSRK